MRGRSNIPAPSAAIWLAAGLALGWTLVADAASGRPHIDRSGRPQTGRASFYGHDDAGKPTASGARFAPQRLTAASRTLPLGTKAKVTNLTNGKSVDVTVTDRGPYAKKRILDVSPKAATQLGLKKKGVATVQVQPLREPPPSKDGARVAANAHPPVR